MEGIEIFPHFDIFVLSNIKYRPFLIIVTIIIMASKWLIVSKNILITIWAKSSYNLKKIHLGVPETHVFGMVSFLLLFIVQMAKMYSKINANLFCVQSLAKIAFGTHWKTFMKFGYARVSKNDQSLDIQIQKLKEVGCDEIFQEKVSGG